MQIGYARAAPSDPVRLGAQLGLLRAAGAEHVVHERTLRPRPALRRCLADLRSGDVLLVATPDRLADTPAELLAIEAALTGRGIGLVVLSIGSERLDSRTSQGRLILAILAGAPRSRGSGAGRARLAAASALAGGQHRRCADQADAD